MAINPDVAQLLVNLAEIAARNSAAAISTRVKAARLSKQQDEALNELESIVNSLVTDREQLIGIAQGLREALIAQTISEDEIRYIVEKLVPTIEALVANEDAAPDATKYIDPLKSLLSVEMLTVLQLVGFNYKAAIGEPLTELVRHLILGQLPDDTANAVALLEARRQVAVLELAQDEAAVERLHGLMG